MTLRNQARASLLARAFSYPYDAPSLPLLFHRGQRSPLKGLQVDADREGFVHVAANGINLGPCLPLLAVGSNAAYSVLRRKFGTQLVSLVQGPVRLHGFARAHSAHIARYGAMPATLLEADAMLESYLQFIPLGQLNTLDASEALGVNYERVQLSSESLQASWLPAKAGRNLTTFWTYRSLHGVARRDGEPMLLGEQRDALTYAADRAGWRLGLEAFVIMLVRDQGFRLAVSEALKES